MAYSEEVVVRIFRTDGLSLANTVWKSLRYVDVWLAMRRQPMAQRGATFYFVWILSQLDLATWAVQTGAPLFASDWPMALYVVIIVSLD